MSITLKKRISRKFHPDDYILHDELQNAIEVAISLDQPLLLTGEPGTGKTKLAWKVADEISRQPASNFSPEPLVFYTKTSSTARDLFYTYDAISHFQASNIKRAGDDQAVETAAFIELQALGKAIAMTDPKAVDKSKFATRLQPRPQSTVVLIDEIDKAPRDFTNDILNEIENYQFQIKEQNNYTVRKAEGEQIVVIMTSNSEKNLPDAFLRRCIFYHIPFPDEALLMKIVRKQLGEGNRYTEQALNSLIKKFDAIRSHAVRKKPATAELISWLRILEMQGFVDRDDVEQKEMVLQNLSVLVKTKEDLDAVRAFLKEI